jgi:hypothetical protein
MKNNLKSNESYPYTAKSSSLIQDSTEPFILWKRAILPGMARKGQSLAIWCIICIISALQLQDWSGTYPPWISRSYTYTNPFKSDLLAKIFFDRAVSFACHLLYIGFKNLLSPLNQSQDIIQEELGIVLQLVRSLQNLVPRLEAASVIWEILQNRELNQR